MYLYLRCVHCSQYRVYLQCPTSALTTTTRTEMERCMATSCVLALESRTTTTDAVAEVEENTAVDISMSKAIFHHTRTVVLNLIGEREREREREMFYLPTHSTHFIYGYMASDIWLRTILIVRKETRCRHIDYSFQPVLHYWCNKGRGMCYPVCGMMHIKEPLLLSGKSSLYGGSGFPLSLSEWSFTICLTPYNRK